MLVNQVELEAVGVRFEQYPTSGLPEIAFAGRSNVGKSSLINALINRKALARTSSQPGKTQTINFYKVEEQLYFVDLPGYGYARTSKEARKTWGKMIEEYLNKRETLGMIILLVDIRHVPNENDQMMLNYIVNAGFHPLVIATKADKIKRSQMVKHLKKIQDAFHLDSIHDIIPFSSMTKSGAEEIWQEIDGWLEAIQEMMAEEADAGEGQMEEKQAQEEARE